jgi:hypothetical protein
MKRFFDRHWLPLLVWAVLAGVSLVVQVILGAAFVPREPFLRWAWLTLLLMLSWGAPVGAWIASREYLRWLRRRSGLEAQG